MIKILYEDPDILAIDKPSGIAVSSILDSFLKKYPKAELAHRLDKETSGVMLLAKNTKAHEFLKKQFQGREIKKVYHTLVEGNVKNDRGIINKPIGRSPADFRRRLAGRGARGEMREAITEYKVLERFTLPTPSLRREGNPQQTPPAKGEMPKAEGVNFTYLEVRPKTGRTHQIRVHMKYLNHPVVGDSLYAPAGPKAPRMMLHALSIEFKNLKGKSVKIDSALPKEFKKYE